MDDRKQLPEEQGDNREVGPGKPPIAHRFKPGQSGNPRGRPVGRSLNSLLREALDKPLPNGWQVADLLAAVIVKAALRGDYRFMTMLLDRTEGKVVARAAVSLSSDSAETAAALDAMLAKAYGHPDGLTDLTPKKGVETLPMAGQPDT